jgi:hypothetical protein
MWGMLEPACPTVVAAAASPVCTVGAGVVWPPLVWCFFLCFFLWCGAVLAGGVTVELLGGGVAVLVGGGVDVLVGVDVVVEVGGGGGGGGAPSATAALTPAHSATAHTATQLAIPLVVNAPPALVCPDDAPL